MSPCLLVTKHLKLSARRPPRRRAAKLEKLRRRQEAAAEAAISSLNVEDDPLSANYGDVPLSDLQSKEAKDVANWTQVGSLTGELKEKYVILRGRIQTIRAVAKKMAFLVVREKGFTVQCVVSEQPELVSRQMVKYVVGLSRESIVDVEGVVSVPNVAIKGATQQVEIQAGEQLVRVNQDTRLNYRVLDMRTPANQGIFRIQCQVGTVVLLYFRLDYKGQPACLAQSPQLHKQMSICGDFGRVFEIGPVFRAEDSFTHRHLCEFTGLDVEMEIKTHYSEVMDIVDRLFVSMFDSMNQNCKKELEAIDKQYPFEPLKYLRNTLRLTFEEGIQMLKDAGVEIDPLGDLNTEAERKLGRLVLEKYGTEFYILHRYPLSVRPFYTMPCHDNPTYSNSFDVFIRGEEIISGAQRVHVPEFLAERAQACMALPHTVDSE
ncbi:Aspartate--tRNA ligase 2, cytoplasmic, partial [Cucurbita argyrosperma subsp. sororia]